MSRKTLVILGLTLVAFITVDKFRSSTAQERASEGKIGDVKYSVLEPAKFTKINGEGWVLMDGRSIEGSDLFTETGIKTAYDAQGVFIRGLNMKRDVTTGDPDGEKRLLGSYQLDMIINHTHKYTSPGPTAWAQNGYSKDNTPARRTATEETQNPTNGAPEVPPISGVETRPRNIALYTYIKINN